MEYTALYRKFRPLNFSEIIGQEHITTTLRNQIKSNRVGHAYLFNGGRGTGKTSAAKVLARAINCLNPQDGEPCNECEICKAIISGSLTDVVEMDAASNNGVEDIRSIREEVNFLPTQAKYRVYIIDEVHMLSTGAFNALLKTLEEPPAHVKFILATTEPQKLPATILSRCQRFDFRKISNENIIKGLSKVCEETKVEVTPKALEIIATLSEGALRDALSILERCMQESQTNIDENKVKDLVGIPKLTYINKILTSIVEYDVETALATIDDVLNDGKDLTNLLWEMIKYTKDVLVYKSAKMALTYSDEEIEKIKNIEVQVTKERLLNIIYGLSELEKNIKQTNLKTIMFQAGIIKLCTKFDIIEKVEERPVVLGRSGKELNVVEKAEIVNVTKENKIVNVINESKAISVSEPKEKAIVLNEEKTNEMAPLSNVQNGFNWKVIIEQLKKNGKFMIATNLINTEAKEINDMTMGIYFYNGLTAFGKTVLEKIENITELTRLISMACGKEMRVKYIDAKGQKQEKQPNNKNLENMAQELDLPFNIIEE